VQKSFPPVTGTTDWARRPPVAAVASAFKPGYSLLAFSQTKDIAHFRPDPQR
jgi:hypothetical protein